MWNFIAVGLGGCLGSIGRYALSGFVHRHCGPFFPAGTLVVNVVGSLLIGCCMAWVAKPRILGESAQLFLVTGILGGFTTFSAFAFESFELFREGNYHFAFLAIAGNLLLGLAAVWAGWSVMSIWRGY